jgi:hypothetical protein
MTMARSRTSDKGLSLRRHLGISEASGVGRVEDLRLTGP